MPAQLPARAAAPLAALSTDRRLTHWRMEEEVVRKAGRGSRPLGQTREGEGAAVRRPQSQTLPLPLLTPAPLTAQTEAPP